MADAPLFAELPAMNDSPKAFVVIAHRSGASMFGRGSEVVKGEDGKPMCFDSMVEAKRKADHWNARLVSPNVFYIATREGRL